MRLPLMSSSARVVSAALGLGLGVTGTACAAPCSDLDLVVANFVSHGASVYLIPGERLDLVAHDAEALTGGHYAGVTRGFLVRGKEELVLGFEIGGCLIDPIRLKAPPQHIAQTGAA
jgi:hypothetical protein